MGTNPGTIHRRARWVPQLSSPAGIVFKKRHVAPWPVIQEDVRHRMLPSGLGIHEFLGLTSLRIQPKRAVLVRSPRLSSAPRSQTVAPGSSPEAGGRSARGLGWRRHGRRGDDGKELGGSAARSCRRDDRRLLLEGLEKGIVGLASFGANHISPSGLWGSVSGKGIETRPLRTWGGGGGGSDAGPGEEFPASLAPLDISKAS